ncbi:MAG: DegT/DnrJ/EryC1/StrS family aminotransferase, partial [Treponema sp.]|nr:DegT/DnrJ/EryC1/StrS family aminotransferase [Treponema sp.]
CDVSYDFPCMSRDLIENSIGKKPDGLEIGAIVLHHTLGFVPDSASITELGIPVIEDISHSYGFWIKVKKDKEEQSAVTEDKHSKKNDDSSGSPFPITNSLYYILGLEERDMLTSGGGALLFAMNRKDALALRNYAGIANEYCLPDINAALAVVQFKEIQRNIERRRDIAEIFIKAVLSLAARTRHKRFISMNDNEYCNYSFSLVLETGLKEVITYAKKKEIEIENAFENTIAGASLCPDCPVSSSLVLRTVNFPLYPRLKSADVERISRLIMTLP